MVKLNIQCKSGCLERFVGGVEASVVSGVQGLDPKQNFQPFIGLVRVKECISGILGIHEGSNMLVLIWLGYWYQEKYKNNICDLLLGFRLLILLQNL